MSADEEKAFFVSVLKTKTGYPQDIQLEVCDWEMSEGTIIQEKMPGMPGHPQAYRSRWDSPESNERAGKKTKPLPSI